MPQCIYLRTGKESKCRLTDRDQDSAEPARMGVAMNSSEETDFCRRAFQRSGSATLRVAVVIQFAVERSAQTNGMSGSTNRLNDERLLLLARNEHSTVFATLSHQYREKLFRAAHRITRTREDAEDAVQDTLLRAFVHLGDFEGRSNFGTWLTRITINSALMILRKKRNAYEIAIDGSNAFGLDGAVYKIAEDAPNPETRYTQTEEQRILRTAIQRLRPNLRVVVQSHLQGRSMRETAEALGISLSAAKARLHHAKKALRRSEALADQQRHRSSR